MSFESIELEELTILLFLNVYIGIAFKEEFSCKSMLYTSLYSIFVSRTS